jgi:PII-like signaling protein
MPYGKDEFVLLRIFVRESEIFKSADRLRDMGFEGCTVIKGIMGYGKTGPASADIVIESLDLPAVIEIFTTYEKFLEKKDELKRLFEGLITLERALPLNS